MTFSTRRTRRVRHRASALLMFIAFAMPLLWAAAAISVDSMKIMEVQRRVGYATESASVAGASEFHEEERLPYNLDSRKATASANEAFNEFMAVAFGDSAGQAGRVTILNVDVNVKATLGGTPDPAATVNPGGRDPARVTVTVRYRVEGLAFLSLVPGADPNLERTISRTSYVCVPEENPYTVGGSCDRR